MEVRRGPREAQAVDDLRKVEFAFSHCHDRYGHEIARLAVDGEDIVAVLIGEELAVKFTLDTSWNGVTSNCDAAQTPAICLAIGIRTCNGDLRAAACGL